MADYGTTSVLPSSRFTSGSQWNCRWLGYLGVWVAAVNAPAAAAAFERLGAFDPLETILSVVGVTGASGDVVQALIGLLAVFALFVAGDRHYGEQLPTIGDRTELFGIQLSFLVVFAFVNGYLFVAFTGVLLDAADVSATVPAPWLVTLFLQNLFVWGGGLFLICFTLRD